MYMYVRRMYVRPRNRKLEGGRLTWEIEGYRPPAVPVDLTEPAADEEGAGTAQVAAAPGNGEQQRPLSASTPVAQDDIETRVECRLQKKFV